MFPKDFFEFDLHLSNKELARLLLDSAKIEQVKKGKLLIESGEQQIKIPFLISGIFRGFVVDVDGSDITDCFAFQRKDVVIGCNGLEAPSRINIEAIVDSEVLTIPTQCIVEALSLQLELMKVYNVYLIDALDRHWEEKMLMHRCSAMERYQWFLKKYPGLIDMVCNKHIASFLGMTPVTLSRLRRQLRDWEAVEKNIQGQGERHDICL